MANNTGAYRQKINSKLPNNNSKYISANLVREVLAAGADAIDEIFETFSLADGLGTYNAATNLALLKEGGTTITPTTVANQDNGKYFDVSVAGTQPITGASVAMAVGGKLISRGTKWDYIPPTDTGYAKAVSNEALIYKKAAEIFNPETITNGFQFLAKGRGTAGAKLIQPDFCFDVSAIAWGGSAIDFVFKCKILLKTANISSITNLLSGTSPTGVPGNFGGSGVTQYGTGGAAIPVKDIVLDYTATKSVSVAKTDFFHNFINFDPIDEDLITEIVIYNPTLTVGGVLATFVGSALFSPNAGDLKNTVTKLSEPAATIAQSESISDERLSYISAPISISGHEYLAKENNLGAVQPIFAFDVSAIDYVTTDNISFSCKIASRGRNIDTVVHLQFFYNESPAIDNTTGTSVTVPINTAAKSGLIQSISVSRTVASAKTSYVHCYLALNLTDPALASSFVIYDVALTIKGVSGARIAGTSLYRTVAGDTISPITKLEFVPSFGTIETKKAEAIAVANAYTDAKFTVLPPSIQTNRLYGKTYAIAGDSIPAGANGIGLANTFHAVMATRVGMTTPIANLGTTPYCIAGTQLTNDNGFGLALSNPDRHSLFDASVDYFFTMIGTNDISALVAIGTDSDTTRATFKGALYVYLEAMLIKYPTKKFGFITPLHHKPDNSDLPYVDAIISFCAKYSIPCLDMYRGAGILPVNAAQRAALMRLGTDYQHPAVNGHAIIADKFEAFVRRM